MKTGMNPEPGCFCWVARLGEFKFTLPIKHGLLENRPSLVRIYPWIFRNKYPFAHLVSQLCSREICFGSAELRVPKSPQVGRYVDIKKPTSSIPSSIWVCGCIPVVDGKSGNCTSRCHQISELRSWSSFGWYCMVLVYVVTCCISLSLEYLESRYI